MEAVKTALLFNGRYTIKNTATDEHRTFCIRTQADDSNFAPGKRVIGLLTGPSNEADYQGFGFVDDDGIHVWTKKRGQEGKRSAFEIMADMLWSLAVENIYSEWAAKGYGLLLEKRCIRCNRTLTTPESIESGIGPVCDGRE